MMQYKYQKKFWKNWNKIVQFYYQQEVYMVQYFGKTKRKLKEEIVYLSINLQKKTSVTEILKSKIQLKTSKLINKLEPYTSIKNIKDQQIVHHDQTCNT